MNQRAFTILALATALNGENVRWFSELDCALIVTVFNIGGNKYRLVVKIIYEYRRIYIKRVMTHPEYDRGNWKDQLCRE